MGGFGGRGVGKQHGTSWQPTCVNGCILVMPRTRASECSSASGVWSFELRLVCAVLAAATARCDLTLIVHRVHVAYEVPAQTTHASGIEIDPGHIPCTYGHNPYTLRVNRRNEWEFLTVFGRNIWR